MYNEHFIGKVDSVFIPYLACFQLCLSLQYLTAISQIVGDITKESTLVPEYFKGVRQVINAVSVIVGPKEGDTPDRAKYSQVCF